MDNQLVDEGGERQGHDCIDINNNATGQACAACAMDREQFQGQLVDAMRQAGATEITLPTVNEEKNSAVPSCQTIKDSELKAAPAFSVGPWSIGRKKNQRSPAHVWVKHRDGTIVADIRNLPPFTSGTNEASETTEALARLIAAAPALYEAAESALDVLIAVFPKGSGAIDNLRTALASVHGGEAESGK